MSIQKKWCIIKFEPAKKGVRFIRSNIKNERILIFDDNSDDCIILKKLVENCIGLSEDNIDTAQTKSEMENLIKNNEYSLIFMDIELDDENGIDIICRLQQEGIDAEIVYVTAHTKYCEDIFFSEPTALIVKPVTDAKIKRAVSIVKRKRNKKSYISLEISKNKTETISLDRVAYIESVKRQIVFFDENSKELYKVSNRKINYIEKMLPDFFVRCHQSICLNMKFVRSIERYFFTLESGLEVPISQSKFQNVRKIYFEYIGGLI